MDKWTELRSAYKVARLGTVSAAAEALGVHRATINRHIDVLEAALGAPVFIRHARGYTMTELGQEVLRVTPKVEEMIEDLAGRAMGSKAQIEGNIKLTILAPFAGLIMKPVAAFQDQNPHCVVEIDASEDLARLEYGEAHIALRAGPKPEHPDYVAASLARVGFNLYAHDIYVEKLGLPKNEDDFEGHRFVVPPATQSRLPFWPWIERHVLPAQVSVSSDSTQVNVEAISAGIGMGFIANHEARARGGFHPVLKSDKNFYAQLWWVTHVDLHRTKKVQAMLTCLKNGPHQF